MTNKIKADRKSWLDRSCISVKDIHLSLNLYFNQYTDEELEQEEDSKENDKMSTFEKKNLSEKNPVINFFSKLKIVRDGTSRYLTSQIAESWNEVSSILNSDKMAEGEKLRGQKKDVAKIKNYLDSIKDLYNFLRPLLYFPNKRKTKATIHK